MNFGSSRDLRHAFRRFLTSTFSLQSSAVRLGSRQAFSLRFPPVPCSLLVATAHQPPLKRRYGPKPLYVGNKIGQILKNSQEDFNRRVAHSYSLSPQVPRLLRAPRCAAPIAGFLIGTVFCRKDLSPDGVATWDAALLFWDFWHALCTTPCVGVCDEYLSGKSLRGRDHALSRAPALKH